jgi:hypothetical protein
MPTGKCVSKGGEIALIFRDTLTCRHCVASIRAISPPLETHLLTGKCVSKGGEIALMLATQCPQVSVFLKVGK